MKNIYSLLIFLITVNLSAQAPQKMSYQAVIRNSSDALVTNTTIGVKISVLQGSAVGTVIYNETQTASTNANGLISLEIGNGTPVIGTFAGISWANGPYFIKTETDPTGGTTYSITGTQQLMSVPYALFSANAKVGGFTHYLGENFNGGIIFYLYKGNDGLEHGLILALTEGLTTMYNTAPPIYINRSWDGLYNTNLMAVASPCRAYINTLGTGWYIPSIDELSKLYQNVLETNRALFNGGHTPLGAQDSNYWSSTVRGDNAFCINVVNGDVLALLKTTYLALRGVRAF
ncbi:hypothetical protein [Flavobacterium sp.]|uniref:hypothetical protein n=1 Tax=Flavobacterium sp. TaxID=239 RepID=UPI003752655A